jgi:hypothetical protein
LRKKSVRESKIYDAGKIIKTECGMPASENINNVIKAAIRGNALSKFPHPRKKAIVTTKPAMMKGTVASTSAFY